LTSDARRGAVPDHRAVLDGGGLDAFVRDHHARLVSLARLVCMDPSEADDAVQGALERAWRRRETLQDADRLRAWLDRIVVREAIRQDRRRRSPIRRLFQGPREISVEYPDGRSGPHQSAALRIAYEALPAEQRVVVALHLHYGYSISQTARIVEAPAETVRSRLRVARQRLRHALEDEPR
jgi:RNA polymerase sigma-70 factor, ECF subfamily